MVRFLVLVLSCTASFLARGEEQGGPYSYLLQTSVKEWHFRPKPDHNNRPRLVNLERIDRTDWIWGAAHFFNSFYQPTWYVYFGQRWQSEWFGTPVYAKLTAGLLHGYKGEYKDQVPFNRNGTSPAILPSFGIRFYKDITGEVVLFGTAGLMLTLGYEFR